MISFTMEQGEMTTIMGPFDSGKSTLLYNVSEWIRRTTGRYG